MQDDFEANGITVEFVETTDEIVYVGYQSYEIDATNLFTELRLVVKIVLEHQPEKEVKGAIFHSERPVIGLWQVTSNWAEQYQNDSLSEMAVTANALHTLSEVSFT